MSYIKNVRSSKLSSQRSSNNDSVTLFELPTETRRSNRLQVSPTKTEDLAVKFDHDIEDAVGLSTTSSRVAPSTPVSGRKRKAETTMPDSSPKKGKAIRLALDIPHSAPDKWEETYTAIKEMRKDGGAPVDEMGCHMAAASVSDPKTKRFITLISLMLSSQTKDEVTHAAVLNLRASLGELTVEKVLAADESTISNAIGKVGFWRRKTQYIRQAAQKIQDEFEGEIPNTLEGLCSLPGVGPKMAFLTLQVAWNLNLGIGVDVHVHRITNRLKWHKVPTKDPEQTRLNLESWLPKELHEEINPLLVGFGQTICLPVGPRCDECSLSRGLCPSAYVGVKSKRQKITAKKASLSVKIEVEENLSNEEKNQQAQVHTLSDTLVKVEDNLAEENHGAGKT
ncbi:DNA-lyase [Hysterangium stoloniferum]|nr:DNA-lyase [Hysterangium stoloniferum]